MTEIPGDGQGSTTAGQGGGPAVTPPPGAPPANNGQPSTIKVGDKVFRADDVAGILNAKAGLEAENKALKAKLDAHETEKLSAQEKLEKQIKEQTEENARLKRENLNTKVGQALAAKGITLRPDLLNLGITDESQIETAVQNLIKENPALVAKPAGQQPIPPGTAPPAGAPPGGDNEKELEALFANAKTLKEFQEAERKLYAMRGQKAPEDRKAI